MIEAEFESFLYADPGIKSDDAVPVRMTRARKAEEILGMSLDIVVDSDDAMYEAMVKLKENGDIRGNIQNAVRKYYIFKNGREFPQLNRYHKRYEKERSK